MLTKTNLLELLATINIGDGQASTTSAGTSTFRLPRSGSRCPYGLTRSFYYEAEKRGLLKLIRIKKPGNQRGITLVSAADVQRLIQTSA